MNGNQDSYDLHCQSSGLYDDDTGFEASVLRMGQTGSSPYKDDFYSYDDDYNCERSLRLLLILLSTSSSIFS